MNLGAILGPSGQHSDAVVVHFQLQTIKSRPHILRETRRKLLVIQRDVQIGQDSALGIHAPNLTQSICDGKMSRMRLVSQRVDDPAIDAVKQFGRGLRKFIDVR